MMRILSRSPKIVIGDVPPYEVRLLAYYANVYRVLTAPADFERSTHPDRLWGDGYSIGFNPYSARGFGNEAKLVDYFSRVAPEILRNSLRECITQYYGKLDASATCFAEKNDNMAEQVVEFARTTFGSLLQIVLVRDPRDLYCSHRSYFRNPPEVATRNVTFACNALLETKKRAAADVLMLRYEDLILHRVKTLERVGSFVSTSFELDDVEDNFSRHGTSRSPATSIGRWREDMTEHEKNTIVGAWLPAIEAFGYDRGPT